VAQFGEANRVSVEPVRIELKNVQLLETRLTLTRCARSLITISIPSILQRIIHSRFITSPAKLGTVRVEPEVCVERQEFE
jgi:hypothetical protein